MADRIRRIAHLSDIHTLQERPGHGVGVHFLSFGRALDAAERRRKLQRAVDVARRGGADHYVISGDLTEIGSDGEYEAFAETLLGTGIDPDRVTLVPGNHDAYTSSTAWARALEGPLRPFRAHAANEAGKVVEHDDLFIVPVDVTCVQAITRSAGELSDHVADALDRRFDDRALSRKPALVVQHHHPYAHARGFWQWIDGLRGYARMLSLLARHANTFVMHGHLHKAVDRVIDTLGPARIFGAPAIVDDQRSEARVRLYDLRGGVIEPYAIATVPSTLN
jgi:3',5'-cyclic-AMP phosphodiesterase